MAPSQTSPTGSAGYTLTELLVVLAIMALVVALAPPLMGAARTGMQARWAAIALAGRLATAREAALDGGTTVAVTLPSGQTVRFYPDGSATGMTARENFCTVAIAPLSGRVSVTD